MCPRSILPVKVTVTINTLLNFNRANFGDGIDIITCEQGLKSSCSWVVFCSELGFEIKKKTFSRFTDGDGYEN